MSDPRQSLGRWGETQAARYLERKGYVILARNVRTPYGEIDLVAQDGGMIVFVEVKTRRSNRFGWPEEAVTHAKQEHLLAAAEDYLSAHPELDGDWRFDVIAIRQLRSGKPLEIVHFEYAFS